MSVTGILTAAGLSTRMGTPKALLPWRNTTMVIHQISTLVAGGCDHVVIVLGHQCASVSDEIIAAFTSNYPITMTCNIDYKVGRATSIKQGILSAPIDSRTFVIIGVDQPTDKSIVARLIGEHIGKDTLITSPRYKGRGGHPVLFSSDLKNQLLRIDDDTQGLKPVFENYRSCLNRIDFETDQVIVDLNDYDDYLKQYRLFGVGN